MKFTTNHSEFFKEWKAGDIRILKDGGYRGFFPYELQKFDGQRWTKMVSYHTLAEAKKAAALYI